MVKTFGQRLSLSQAPADLATSQSMFPMNQRLTGAGWSQVVNEYIASGLLAGAAPFKDKLAVEAAIERLTIANPANLGLTAALVDVGEDTSATAGSSMGRGGTREKSHPATLGAPLLLEASAT